MTDTNSSQMMATCPYFNAAVDPRNLRVSFDPILTVIRPLWEREFIQYDESPLTTDKGLINTMVKCHNAKNPEDAIMIRVSNEALTGLLQTPRTNEINGIKHLSTKGCAPKLLATFQNGFCYKYIHGEVLSRQRLQEEVIWRCIAEEFAKYHTGTYEDEKLNRQTLAGIVFLHKFLEDFPTKLNNVQQNKRFQNEFPSVVFFKNEVAEILDYVTKLRSPIVLCHLDTRPENMVWNSKTGTVHFVDFELVGYGYQAMEIAVHFLRYVGINNPDFSLYPNEQLQLQWIRVYLSKSFELNGRNANDVTDMQVKRLQVQVEKFRLVALLLTSLWISWANVIDDVSPGQIDWMTLSVGCLNEYKNLKEKILAMVVPEA